ncbi:MAG TPA: hypothetical protein VF823_11920 [Anaerolineales bacterium]
MNTAKPPGAGTANGRISICVTFPCILPGRSFSNQAELDDIRSMAAHTRRLSRDFGVRITQDGHSRGTIRFAHDALDLLGSDVVGPDLSYDMFRHMFQAMRYHRTYYHDPSVLPPTGRLRGPAWAS